MNTVMLLILAARMLMGCGVQCDSDFYDDAPWGAVNSDAELIAQVLYGEYQGPDKLQQAAVVWCIVSRVGVPGFADTIEGVVKQPNQFMGYSPENPVLPELYDMACDVMERWEREKLGETDVGRVLPADYLWFTGDGRVNTFRNAYEGDCDIWDWSLASPYDGEACGGARDR